ncbi:MAG: hypothetical protein H6724_03620 [Sandaracinus sp.]|nr:hypothetical protein [Sandaracinus sp.]
MGRCGVRLVVLVALTTSLPACQLTRSDRVEVHTSDQCAVCHLPEYEATTSPVHEGLYPPVCQTCHLVDAWVPSTLVHEWPLVGAHASVACAGCHVPPEPVYAGLPSECVDCHRDDYDASPYPGHGTFPLTCMDCHTTDGWSPALGATHPESAFPIRSGAHSRFTCFDCHDIALGPSTGGMNTDCIGCHTGEHTRSRMDRKHDEVRDYPAGDAPPNFCLDCHPRGRH